MRETQGQPQSPFLSHLLELKRRLRLSAAAYFIGVLVLMNYSEPVFDFIAAPLRGALPPGAPMVFLSAPDVFFTYLKIALLMSLFATAPITLYELWAFVAPGLYARERKAFLGYFFSSLVLLIAGAAFAYYAVLPLIFQFFLGFASDQLQAFPAVKEYLSLALKLLFAFAVSFQIPIALMVLSRLDLMDPGKLGQKRRYIYVWILVAAALLTPPDVVSQLLLAVPMVLLFELGLWLARLGRRRKVAQDTDFSSAER